MDASLQARATSILGDGGAAPREPASALRNVEHAPQRPQPAAMSELARPFRSNALATLGSKRDIIAAEGGA
jgi:hypothetical protein